MLEKRASSITIVKDVTGDGAGLVDYSLVYPVKAAWTAASENVSVSADGREAITTVTDEAGAHASMTLENGSHAVPEKPVENLADKGPDTNGKGGLPFTGASGGEHLLWATILVSVGALIVYPVRRRTALN